MTSPAEILTLKKVQRAQFQNPICVFVGTRGLQREKVPFCWHARDREPCHGQMLHGMDKCVECLLSISKEKDNSACRVTCYELHEWDLTAGRAEHLFLSLSSTPSLMPSCVAGTGRAGVILTSLLR